MSLTVTRKIRTANGIEDVELTPMKAIRQKYLDCCCWQQVEVRRCPSVMCPLHPYRMGHGVVSSTQDDDFEDDSESG